MTYNLDDYIEDAHRTAPEQNKFVVHDEFRHAVQGIVTEVGELSMVFVMSSTPGMENDYDWLVDKVKDELGDMNWYVALALHQFEKDYQNDYLKLDSGFMDPGFCDLFFDCGAWPSDIPKIMQLMTASAGRLMALHKKLDNYNKEFGWDEVRKHLAGLAHCDRALRRKFKISDTELCAGNIAKLEERFPEKFDAKKAIEKDEESEHKARRLAERLV